MLYGESSMEGKACMPSICEKPPGYGAGVLGQGETLARHRETLMNLARKNLHTIGEIYAEVVSGETIRARPEMKRLLADVSARPVGRRILHGSGAPFQG